MDKPEHFPVKIFMLILIFILMFSNFYLYNELKYEKDKRYWISGNEYKQIVEEIKRLENIPVDSE
jgi:uncharacterized membrane protein